MARWTGIPAPSTWHHTIPPLGDHYERRWERRLRAAPTLSPEEHAAAVADPARRAAEHEEPIGCSLCGERRLQPLLHPRDRRGRWDYHVVRCAGCGLLYRHPGIRPDRLHHLYAGGYGAFLGGAYARQRKRRYRVVLDAFAPLFDAGEGRRLLDFGCGTGLFLEIAHRRGFECHGVDLAPDAVGVASGKPFGGNVHVGAPLDVPSIAAGGFDVITMWSVLAHLPCPVEDLTMLRGLLAPGGVLLILTVNANALLLKRRLDRWTGFTTNHLKFYAPDTLSLLLERAGFASVETRPAYGDHVETGRSQLTRGQERRYRRSVERGNRGNMLRAVAHADLSSVRT
jgi:SAM-dependent methyltransferase